MGYETRCTVIARGSDGTREASGTAVLLETDELVVRGPARTRIPRHSITKIRLDTDRLTVSHPGGTLTLVLGGAAKKWADKLAEPPKSRLDKLGITEDTKVSVIGIGDRDFLAELAARTTRISRGRARSSDDVVLLGVERAEDLTAIPRLARRLAPAAALWVVHPKGPQGVSDTSIFAVAREAGLTYIKVARFSATHTAEKLVIPRERRPPSPTAAKAGRGRATGSAR